ncbi:MAG TPA: phosphoribosyltransferase family protein [Myxococcales bacterium]|nr:phosphoribosyltransferase family protein [Myxococcales bacterium]
MSVVFHSRLDAGMRLAKALEAYRGRNPLVLAIPRGAVEMGAVIAEALGGELDVVLVRKLRAPSSPEFAVGSVDETGWTYIADHAAQAGADQAYLASEKAEQLELLRRRRAQYTPARPPADPRGRVAIVVDDGIATGASMIAALHAVRAREPARLVCAVPVAPAESLEQIRPYADEVLCLETPADFYAVGQFYRHFAQVEDEAVVKLLARHGAKREAKV